MCAVVALVVAVAVAAVVVAVGGRGGGDGGVDVVRVRRRPRHLRHDLHHYHHHRGHRQRHQNRHHRTLVFASALVDVCVCVSLETSCKSFKQIEHLEQSEHHTNLVTFKYHTLKQLHQPRPQSVIERIQ